MASTRPKIKYSVRAVFIGIFCAFLLVTVGLLNVYPTTTARDVVFSAKQSAMLSRAGVMSASLAALEKLSGDGVEQVMGLVGAGEYDRAVVTDQTGVVLYDTDARSGLPGTVFREEASDAARQEETVNSELNRIDACFVDGNADGITEIRKNAEEDSGLSSWNRLRIMNECTLALMDLGAENLLRQMDRNPQGGR